MSASARAIDVDDVRRAADRLRGQVQRTPTVQSRTLSAITGVDLWVKFEQQQYTASFKERGALNRLLCIDDDARARGVIAVSAGNHAQGVAYHAARLGIPATIVMPVTTPNTKVQRTEVLGARVVLHGLSFEEAAAHAAVIAAAEGLEPIHPFDDPLVMAGQGTIGLEVLADVEGLETIVVPIGGGGLISGIATAVKAIAPHVEVVGVQAAAYPWATTTDDVPAPANPSIAEGIAVKRGGVLTRAVIDDLVDDIVLVGEHTIEDAIGLYLEIEKVVAEGAGAASLAAVLEHPERFRGRRTAVLLCGGNIDLRLLADVARRVLERTGRVSHITIPIDDRPGELARALQVVATTGANVLEISHQRHRDQRSAKTAIVEIEVETSGVVALHRTVEALRSAGFDPAAEH